MPELPEVETIRRQLEPLVAGRAFGRIDVRRADLRLPLPPDFKDRFEAGQVIALARRGKYLLFLMQEGGAFALHLGMSGRILLADSGQGPHDHIVFTMADGTRFVFRDPRRFGYVLVMPSCAYEAYPPFEGMGPEPLGDIFDGPLLQSRLAKRKGPIKTALLDQKLVAGIGNIYACEALYMAGIAPDRKCDKLDPDDCARLAQALKDVLQKALAAGGSTLRDYRRADGEEGQFQYAFAVYDRAGKACPGCVCDPVNGEGIKRLLQAGRSTFYCPHKQV